MRKKNRFKAAYHGLSSVFESEQNFRIHLFAFVIVILFGVFFGLSNLEWIAILSCSFLVLICEVFNTAVEKLCDHISPNYDVLIGKVKDISAAAVLVSSIMSVVVGAIVFIPYLIELWADRV